ncbi:MAG: hypothetical protein ABWZ76_09865 [Acidimicrobiales bacterium]
MVQATMLAAGGAEAVVVKHATGADAPRLARMGARLREAAHPGVVEVLSSEGSTTEWELRLVHGGRPLDVVGRLSAERVAGIAAAVAATLADLHDAGIVHGRLDASRVLLGADGRPVLCGFALPDAPGGLDPADDVAALGALMVDLLDGGDDLEPIPDRRWRRRGAWSGWNRRALLTIADQACSEPPSRRPTARRLAATISDAVPDARSAGAHRAPKHLGRPSPADDTGSGHDLRPPSDHSSRRRSRAVLLVVCGVLGSLLLVAARLGQGGPGAERTPLPPGAADTEPVGAPGAEPCVSPVELGLPDAGDCLAGVRIDGTTIIAATRRFEVGQPGDIVTLGDWDCSAGATPAILRPSSGEVFVFPSWAAGENLVVRAVTVVPGAIDIAAVVPQGPAGCAALEVRTASGAIVDVPTVGSS